MTNPVKLMCGVVALLGAMQLFSAACLGAEPAGGRQVEAVTAVRTGTAGDETETKLHYWLYLPSEYESKGEQKWPLLLFLHGSGERGDDLALVTKHGPPKLIAAGKAFPMLVVSPQCPKEKRWNAAELAKLVDELANTYRVDRTRLYVTGLSMGGAGTWSLLSEHPNKFAAAVPICGRVGADAAAKLTNVPLWIVVGAKDRAELVASNKQAAEAIEKAGGQRVKLTVYPDAGHDSWTETYDNPALYEWLLKQQLSTAN